MHDTLQYHIYVRRKFHSSVACYKFTTYCTQIHKHLYSEGARHGLSCCIYIRTKFALLSASLNDKLYSRHFSSCFFNSWVHSVQQAKTMRQREANVCSSTKNVIDFQEHQCSLPLFYDFVVSSHPKPTIFSLHSQKYTTSTNFNVV